MKEARAVEWLPSCWSAVLRGPARAAFLSHVFGIQNGRAWTVLRSRADRGRGACERVSAAQSWPAPRAAPVYMQAHAGACFRIVRSGARRAACADGAERRRLQGTRRARGVASPRDGRGAATSAGGGVAPTSRPWLPLPAAFRLSRVRRSP